MQPVDVVVLILAALSVFYLPFLSARLVMWLLFGRRPVTKGQATTVLDLTVVTAGDLPEVVVASSAALVLPDTSEVLDLNELFHYLSDQRAGDAEALLTQFLHSGQLASTQRP